MNEDLKKLDGILRNKFVSRIGDEFQGSSSEDKDFNAKFAEFVDSLRRGGGNDSKRIALTTLFVKKGGLVSLLLQQRQLDRTLCSRIVKLHDIWCNSVYKERRDDGDAIDAETIVSKVLHSLLVAQFSKPSSAFVFMAVGSAMVNYSPLYPDQTKAYVKSLADIKAQFPTFSLHDLITNFPSDSCRQAFVKAVVNHCDSGEEIFQILSEDDLALEEVYTRLLLSRTSLLEDSYGRLVCFLYKRNRLKEFGILLGKVLKLWSDPVIAKAHVASEVLHYTRLVFIMFRHLGKREALNFKGLVFESLTKGLPNHFNTVDVRTLNLAKFLCQLLTESLKLYEDDNESEKPEFPIDEYLGDATSGRMCLEIANASAGCCKASTEFWLSRRLPLPCDVVADNNKKALLENVQVEGESIDSDDDSDLEPIESNEIGYNPKIKIVFLRDFLDNVGEIETCDEMEYAMSTLPGVIAHQLRLEHVDVAKEVVDSLFRWENDFDKPALDKFRNQGLCSVLKSSVSVTVPRHFCKLFHRTSTQPRHKNLILDVLSRVSKEISLSKLLELSRCSFEIILYDEMAIAKQDASVKIPMILFFSRLVGNTLPKEMVDERMVVSYLNCLNRLDVEEAAIEQSVRYALSNIVQVLERLQNISSDGGQLESAFNNTKTWLCRVHAL